MESTGQWAARFVKAAAVPPEHRQRALEHPHEATFWHDIEPMPGGVEVLRELLRRHEVFLVSAAMEVPASLAPKYAWIRQYFPFFPDSHIVFCGDKSVIASDYLIDDHARHFEHYRGTGLLFDAPHNRHETRFERLMNWDAVAARFLK